MAIYETVFIARQELSATQVAELTKKYSALLTQGGGKILKTEDWGMRTLAYRINKNRKGHYVLIESETTGPALIETERQMRLDEDVLRYLSLKLDAATTEASKILQKDKGEDQQEAA